MPHWRAKFRLYEASNSVWSEFAYGLIGMAKGYTIDKPAFFALMVLAPLASGCGPDTKTVPLSGFSRGKLFFRSGNTAATLGFDVFLDGGLPGCPTLASGVSATLNGLTLRERQSGGPQGSFTSTCDPASFGLDLPLEGLGAPQDGRIELSDSSARITMVVHNMVGVRTLTPRQALSSVTGGQKLAFDYTPADDVFDSAPHVTLAPDSGKPRGFEPTRTGGLIEVVLPNDIGPGAALLRFNFSPSAKSQTCTGVSTCEGFIGWMLDETITVVP